MDRDTQIHRIRRGNSRIIPLVLILLAMGGAVALGILLPTGGSRSTIVPRGVGSGGGSGGGSATNGEQAAVLLTVIPPRLDFGIIAPNAVVMATIEIRNDGTRDVAINDMITSCSCVSVHFVERVVPAGGSIHAEVQLEAPDRQDTSRRFTMTINPAIGKTTPSMHITHGVSKVFDIEPITDESFLVTGARVRSLDDSAFTIVETPPFVRVDEPFAEPSTGFDLMFGEPRDGQKFSVQFPALVLAHPVHGEIVIDWSDQFRFPEHGRPPMRANPEIVSLIMSTVTEGTHFDVLIEGPTERELDDITIEMPSVIDLELRITNAVVVPEGIRYTLYVQAPADRWEGGTVLFLYKGIPGCTMRITDDRVQ